MKIFSDMHHGDLFYSLQLLWEKRLGWKIYRPIGLEWYQEGFWNIFPHIDTAKQYLMDGYIPKDQTPALNSITRIQDGIHYIKDNIHNCEQKAITLEQFREMKFDIVLASIPQHIEPFKKLLTLYQPQAKFVFQMGNRFNEVIRNLHIIPNLLSSTIEIPVPSSCDAVFYHQEFDLDIFKPISSIPEKKIVSFINIYSNNGGFYSYMALKGMCPEYEFKSYGAQCDDGIISGIQNISSIMQKTYFGFHVKSGADGFGHILHGFFACGTPVIINYEEYKKELGGKLLIPDETCLTIDSDSDIPRVAERIKTMSPHEYLWIRNQAYGKFKEVVNFDEEEKSIRLWLQNLR